MQTRHPNTYQARYQQVVHRKRCGKWARIARTSRAGRENAWSTSHLKCSRGGQMDCDCLLIWIFFQLIESWWETLIIGQRILAIKPLTLHNLIIKCDHFQCVLNWYALNQFNIFISFIGPSSNVSKYKEAVIYSSSAIQPPFQRIFSSIWISIRWASWTGPRAGPKVHRNSLHFSIQNQTPRLELATIRPFATFGTLWSLVGDKECDLPGRTIKVSDLDIRTLSRQCAVINWKGLG